ncbi:MAG TPA: phosphate/phosphite/phosphonate ABC transporter substrate-binding protein [Phototrophicaceae bacterium]|nr:phosphate/phosphite/phosphonate ABC transporter substrate-binding protein [Phototrophicaceae bacterium]
MKKSTLALIAVLIVSLFSLSLASAQSGTPEATAAAVDKTGWPDTFIIGVYPGDNIDKALAQNQPLADYLTKELGVRTVVITGTSYNAVIEAMRAGRADAFEVGPFSYLIAAEQANAEALVVGNYFTDVNTNILPGYYSVIFTKKGSGIKTIDDLKGKTFSFSDPASTSGYEIPATDIMDAEGFTSKDQLDAFFGQVIFAGSHPASVIAVANGKVDAGATFDANLSDQVKAGYPVCGVPDGDYTHNPFATGKMTQDQIDQIYNDCPDGELAVIHQSNVIPNTPFAINKNLPQSFKDAVKAALLDLANHQDVVDALGRYYIDVTKVDPSFKSNDAYFDGLRNVATKLGLDLSLPS